MQHILIAAMQSRFELRPLLAAYYPGDGNVQLPRNAQSNARPADEKSGGRKSSWGLSHVWHRKRSNLGQSHVLLDLQAASIGVTFRVVLFRQRKVKNSSAPVSNQKANRECITEKLDTAAATSFRSVPGDHRPGEWNLLKNRVFRAKLLATFQNLTDRIGQRGVHKQSGFH